MARKRRNWVYSLPPKPFTGAVVTATVRVSVEELRDKLNPQQLKAFMQGLGEVIASGPEREAERG